jgi:glutathione S-transferase
VYKLYVIPGSHACRSARMMLETKGVPFETVEFVTATHSVMARLHGFNAGGERRATAGKRTFGIRIGDALGTVPALNADGTRVSTNHGIARFLDATHPEPPLIPSDPGERAAVEEAERWGNEVLQMEARRILGAAVVRDPEAMAPATSDGRLGYLLYRNERIRKIVAPWILSQVFQASPSAERDPIGELPALLDEVDAWIGAGVLGGEQPNAADCMIAPSLAIILYRSDAAPIFAGRPSLELVDRLLPEPA